MGERFYTLEVSDVVVETPDARSVVFSIPPEHASAFSYRAGQFLTLRIPSDQTGSVARCYSLSTAPHENRVQVTVKRTGYASGWICDHLEPGMSLDVLAPAGVFCPSSMDEDFLLLAAGSGITPVMAILKSVLASGSGRVVLVYANRDERSVIFAAELAALASEYGSRLVVVHWLESLQGLPDVASLRGLAAPFVSHEAFVCGPAPFMAAVRSALAQLGFARDRVHVEKYTSLSGNPFEAASPVVEEAPSDESPVSLTVSLDGVTRSVSWPRQRKLLDHLLEEGFDAPYSCREGQCSACACRLVSGEVKMLHNEVLDGEDIADGIVLACQSLPLTDDVSISYE